MNRRDFLKIAGTAGAVAAANGCRGLVAGGGEAGGGNGAPPPLGNGDINDVEHIIFTMQENRSFDHYFGKLPDYRANKGYPGTVDGLPVGGATNPSYDDTTTIASHHMGTDQHENLSPAWNESHRCWNRHDPAGPTPTLDGFVYAAANYSRQTTSEPACDFEGRRAMGYYTENELPYYYELASQFAMSDRHFSSVLTATQPNRMYLLSGSSHGYIRPLRETAGDRQIAAPTIFDALEDKGITWKIYLQDKGAPHAYSYYALFQGYNSHTDKVVAGEQFFTDLQNGNLPQVAMFESGVSNGLDEHPRNDIFKGTQIMRRFFNAIMGSSIWQKSVTFFTYDEGGAFYDHVPPPSAVKPDDIPPKLVAGDTAGDFDRYGYRVPFIAVSPFARQHYVSHTVSDHTSLLKFIEKRFGLSPLTQRDANAHDLTDMFDFANPSFTTPPALPGDGAHPLDRCNV
ncbi:MAG: twin-arginine translocation signal domain-containing protein [Candidatus Koribacter versatilis]|uniref:phospholipase C n=1 Tax=Candidatus Korobacter versatilis TaxID=658062 RepID=A0A932AA00_9BACT|nr:twin-arginine translocation signal domain-containing protein [Candidatus Koribacter versatilis]